MLPAPSTRPATVASTSGVRSRTLGLVMGAATLIAACARGGAAARRARTVVYASGAELQSLNPEPDRATDEMVLFMVMNASSVTLVPISILTFRAQLGAKNPADVFVPILIATFISDLSGLLIVAAIQKLNLWNRVVLAWLAVSP